MNVVDSSAWLEYFAAIPSGMLFANAIVDPAQVIVSTVNIYEVFKRILQIRTDQDAFYAVAVMLDYRVIEPDTQLSLEAVLLARKHKLAFADSIILATALAFEATLWTQDAHFAGIAGVKYIAKP